MLIAPNNIAFTISYIDIHWYGILMSLAMLIGLFVIFFVRNKYFKEISTDNICDIAFILIVLGLLSARLYYVILDFDYFEKHPFEILAIWKGGISIQGAIIGGILAGYYITKINKLNFFRYADLFCFGLVSGQVIGRWGNFFNAEAFGLPTNLPWGQYIPYSLRPENFQNFECFHPTFLYESILNLILLICLYIYLKKKDANRKDGIIFCLYLIGYSIIRILVETIRVDSVLNIGVFHIAHITAIIIIIFAISLMFLLKKEDKQIL